MSNWKFSFSFDIHYQIIHKYRVLYVRTSSCPSIKSWKFQVKRETFYLFSFLFRFSFNLLFPRSNGTNLDTVIVILTKQWIDKITFSFLFGLIFNQFFLPHNKSKRNIYSIQSYRWRRRPHLSPSFLFFLWVIILLLWKVFVFCVCKNRNSNVVLWVSEWVTRSDCCGFEN